MKKPGTRRYKLDEAAAFRNTRETFGAFHNPAAGFPLIVEGIEIGSSEAYYQAMRFPDAPDIQRAVLAETVPIQSKRKAYEFLEVSRDDWFSVNVAVMRHALRLKLSQHRTTMLGLFERSAGMPIVEVSTRDAFWGAKPEADGIAVGQNVLGRLWMELRQELELDPHAYLEGVEAPDFPGFTLLGRKISFTPVPKPAQMALDM